MTTNRTTRAWKIHLAVLAVYLGLGMLVSWPLPRHWQSVPGDAGDNAYFAYLTRWYGEAMAMRQPLFFNPWLNYPAGWNLASTETAPAAVFPGVPVARLWGGAAGFNTAMLLTFMFSGWAMFAWLRRLTGSLAAGLVAGTAYALLPYHLAHYQIGHLNLATLQWFPLFFWGFWDLLGARRTAWKPALQAGLSLGLIALTSMYMLYISSLIAGVFGLIWLLTGGWRRLGQPILWLNGVLGAIFGFPLTLAGMLPFLRASAGGGLASRTLEVAAANSASPTDYLIPWPGSLLWGSLTGKTYLGERWIEQSLYIGAVCLFLALTGLVLVRKQPLRRLVIISALTGLAAFVLSLGVHLQWQGHTLLIAGHPVPLPGWLLFEYLPFFDRMRALARFGFYVSFFAVVMAGVGTAAWLGRLRPPARLVLALLLLGLISLDAWPRPVRQFTSLEPRAVDRWLAAQPGREAVAVFPFSRQADQDLVFHSLDFRKPYIGGFYSANYPDEYWQMQPALDTFPSAKAVMELKQLGVGYVMVETWSYADLPGLRRMCEELGLEWLSAQEGIWVFGVPPG